MIVDLSFMRIVLIHTHVLEDLGSIGIRYESYASHAGYEHRYARLLNEHGVEADLVIFSRKPDKVRLMRHAWGHRIIVVPLKGVRFFRHVRLLKTLSTLVAGYDLVHCFSYYSNIYDVLTVACRLAGVPLVAQAQGIYPNIALLPSLRKMFTLRLASSLVPLNKAEAKFLLKKFRIAGSRITIVPNFIEPRDHEQIPRWEARRMLGLNESAFVVLTVCRLVPEKGVQTLLEAAAKIRDRISELVVVVVGEGPYRGSLETLAKKLGLEGIVRFEGYVPNREVGKYYSAADLFVLASLEESFGIVLLEAMLFSLPVVSSCTWGPSDIVVDGETGFLFKPGDASALAEALLQLYESPVLRSRMGELGKTRVTQHYQPYKIYVKLKEVYDACRR